MEAPAFIRHTDVFKIGLMADSHGMLDVIEACIDRFQRVGVDLMVHLGDFLDSQFLDHTLAIIDTLKRHHVLAIKGNNDYQIENALKNNGICHIHADQRKKILHFLAHVPMRAVMKNICFTHSLPYDSIRSIYEPIDTGEIHRAQEIFNHTDHDIIFAGHSHLPILFRNISGKVTREPIASAYPVNLPENGRFIIIIGSLTNGESGIMDLRTMSYERMCCE